MNDYIHNKSGETQSQDEQEMDNWKTFCDFPEISLIAIQGVNVCISRQDNMSMVNSLVKLYLVSIFCVCMICILPTYICVPGHAFGLQSPGSLSGVTAWWVFPPYNRCTSLSLSRSGSTESGSQWDQRSARSHTVRHSRFHMQSVRPCGPLPFLLTCSFFSLLLGMSLCSKN